MNFTTSKNGYNKKEVDLFLNDLTSKINELERDNLKISEELKLYKNKEKENKDKSDSISIALTAAVEKAKQIEKSSNNVYKLKIQQINLLYSKWEKLLNVILEKYPQIEEVENVKNLLHEFKNNIKSTLKNDYKLCSITSPVQTDNDTIRLLLSKLGTHSKQEPQKIVKVQRKQLPKDMRNSQSELSRIEDKAPLIKPIYNSTIKDGENYENLADKFLKEDVQESDAYANIITSKIKDNNEVDETGFDLKEAVNPKEDLDEIMKAFDFFNNNEA